MGVRVCSHVPCGAHRGFATAVLRLVGRAQGCCIRIIGSCAVRSRRNAPCCVAVREQHTRTSHSHYCYCAALTCVAHCYIAARGGLLNADHASCTATPARHTVSQCPHPGGRRAGILRLCHCAARSRRNTPYRAAVRGQHARTSPFALLLLRGASERRAACCLAARGSTAPRVGAFAARFAESAQIPPRFAHFCALTHPSARAKLLNFR